MGRSRAEPGWSPADGRRRRPSGVIARASVAPRRFCSAAVMTGPRARSVPSTPTQGHPNVVSSRTGWGSARVGVGLGRPGGASECRGASRGVGFAWPRCWGFAAGCVPRGAKCSTNRFRPGRAAMDSGSRGRSSAEAVEGRGVLIAGDPGATAAGPGRTVVVGPVVAGCGGRRAVRGCTDTTPLRSWLRGPAPPGQGTDIEVLEAFREGVGEIESWDRVAGGDSRSGSGLT